MKIMEEDWFDRILRIPVMTKFEQKASQVGSLQKAWMIETDPIAMLEFLDGNQGLDGWPNRKEFIFLLCKIVEGCLHLIKEDKQKYFDILEDVEEWSTDAYHLDQLSEETKAIELIEGNEECIDRGVCSARACYYLVQYAVDSSVGDILENLVKNVLVAPPIGKNSKYVDAYPSDVRQYITDYIRIALPRLPEDF